MPQINRRCCCQVNKDALTQNCIGSRSCFQNSPARSPDLMIPTMACKINVSYQPPFCSSFLLQGGRKKKKASFCTWSKAIPFRKVTTHQLKSGICSALRLYCRAEKNYQVTSNSENAILSNFSYFSILFYILESMHWGSSKRDKFQRQSLSTSGYVIHAPLIQV